MPDADADADLTMIEVAEITHLEEMGWPHDAALALLQIRRAVRAGRGGTGWRN